jgi:formylglycine-generating enzyme required for sulfatase activity
MKIRILAVLALTLLAAFNAQLSTARAQNTTFTYQGRVLDNGSAFTGTGQFQFALVYPSPNQQAVATPIMGGLPPFEYVNGFTIGPFGFGYLAAPAVTITGGGGSGAVATANLLGSSVTSLTIISPGSGYSSAPTVTIAPPPISYLTYWSNDGTSVNGSEPATNVTVAVTNGLFTVVLGDTTISNMAAIPVSVFNQPNLQLQIWFNDGTHGFAALNPPQPLTPTPYAVYANTASNANYATTAGSAASVAAANITGTISVAATNITGTIPTAELPASIITNGATGVNITLATPPGMVLIPAGSFTMGNSIGDSDITDANPTNIYVSQFYMDINLVSLSQWKSVYYWATNQGYGFADAGAGKAANNPVQTVDWFDCVKWCNARSQQAGRTPVYYTDAGYTHIYTNLESYTVYVNPAANGYRLPTEAEWEKAARGGLSGQRFPWGNNIDESVANYYGATASYTYDLGPNGYNAVGSVGGTSPATSPVGSFAPNGYGLYDMAGNVFEWCGDWYGTPYGQPTATNPTGPATGSYRVLRGGNWFNDASYARCATRNNNNPNYAFNDFGFRCVRGL